MSVTQETRTMQVAETRDSRKELSRAAVALYGVCATAAIAVWFPAIGAPLWVDETWSYWAIAKGFREIPLRQDPLSFPAHSYILWLATQVLGTSEMALRIPSLLAMLGAAWLVYLAAREIFERDLAMITVVVFCLEPVVIFASGDARPYAFATLMTSAAILLLLRLRRTDAIGPAVLLGLAAAGAVWFHFLFAVIGPALVMCFFAVKRGSGKAKWRQLGLGACGFAVGMAPVIPATLEMFRTRVTHVFVEAPTWWDLVPMITPGMGALALLVAALLAVTAALARQRRAGQDISPAAWDGAVCAVLALVPMGILYGVSTLTAMHVSNPRWHMLVSTPGIALLWAWLAQGWQSPRARAVFCALFTAAGLYRAVAVPVNVSHMPSDQYALAKAERLAKPDDAPVLVCSDFVESDYTSMPLGEAKESRLFAQLSYYQLRVPVVPLPWELNAEAMRVGSEFVEQAAARHERFLAMGHPPSYETLDWLRQRAEGAYFVRVLGVYSDVKLMEFTPRVPEAATTREK